MALALVQLTIYKLYIGNTDRNQQPLLCSQSVLRRHGPTIHNSDGLPSCAAQIIRVRISIPCLYKPATRLIC